MLHIVFLATKKPIAKSGSDTFTSEGFKSWKKVNNGRQCSFVVHEGNNPCYAHKYSVECYENLRNQLCGLKPMYEKKTLQEVLNKRLRLKTSIEAVRWLTFQACAFRGHDESPSSRNQGNFLELVKLLASYNSDVNSVVLDNAPKSAKYIAPEIQKEILHVYSMNVQAAIREEIGKGKFCLIVDESRDESKKEQMAIVIRFVDRQGFVRERFFYLIHVKDTCALTLKNAILSCLAYHKLDVQDIRGQRYDGASNMRGEWNGLQALILNECPQAYYVHCLAHQLQLALVAAAKDVSEVHTFFQNLNFIVNVIGSSCKRNDQLEAAQLAEIQHLTEVEELETGKGANQIQTLQRPADTRWSSHFKSICCLMNLFGATSEVLADIATKGSTSSQRGDASFTLRHLLSFDFVLVMHVMKEVMGITDMLCHALQQRSQDVVNALTMVLTTKELIQKLREERWDSVLNNVISFCGSHDILVPNMSETYTDIVRSRHKKNTVTFEHHYRLDVFTAAIDHQLQELNSRFSESVTELLPLSAALDPRISFKSFNVEDICRLAETFYPLDFTDQEIILLSFQLQHYVLDVSRYSQLKNVRSMSELCKGLQETEKSDVYHLIDRFLRLVLTLPVSTATSERAFSAMKIVKTRLRSKMADDFLKNYLIVLY